MRDPPKKRRYCNRTGMPLISIASQPIGLTAFLNYNFSLDRRTIGCPPIHLTKFPLTNRLMMAGRITRRHSSRSIKKISPQLVKWRQEDKYALLSMNFSKFCLFSSSSSFWAQICLDITLWNGLTMTNVTNWSKKGGVRAYFFPFGHLAEKAISYHLTYHL